MILDIFFKCYVSRDKSAEQYFANKKSSNVPKKAYIFKQLADCRDGIKQHPAG